MKKQRIAQYIGENFDKLTSAWVGHLSQIAEHETPDSFEALTPLTQHVFQNKSPSKGMLKTVRRALFELDRVDVTALSLSTIFSKTKTNPDALIQLVATQKTALSSRAFNALQVQHTNVLYKHIDERRLLTLLWSTDISELKDAMRMMMRIDKAMPDLRYIPKKLKSIKELHDRCVRLIPRLSVADFDLCQREDILMMDKKPLRDGMVIRVPKTHYDLVQLGESLGFCIGNGQYSEDVKERRCSIVSVFNKEGPLYGIQFSRYSIMQARGFGNERINDPSRDLLMQLSELLLSKPKFPTDFLPIEDSTWVKGYRYDNKDLYLLFNGLVYVYFDVPQDIYEGLLQSNRKGTFVNTMLKSKYEYAKIGSLEQIQDAEADGQYQHLVDSATRRR